MYVQENPNFEFETIEDAIKLGYKKLNKIFQVFYKRVKNYTITPLTNNLKSQLAYCTFGCLKKLATF